MGFQSSQCELLLFTSRSKIAAMLVNQIQMTYTCLNRPNSDIKFNSRIFDISVVTAAICGIQDNKYRYSLENIELISADNQLKRLLGKLYFAIVNCKYNFNFN